MNLTKSQQEAVNNRSPLLVVDSLAGTGKTTVIVERVRRILSEGVAPHKIMVVTFTNKMGDELKEKLPGLKWVGNFHKIALRMINKYRGEHFILSEREWKDTIKDIADRTSYKKNGAALLKKEKNDEYLGYNEKYFVEEYHKYMRANALLTYDDIEEQFMDMLENGEVKESFRHVIIDEFQDTTEIEMAIINGIKSDYVMVVGDPAQNIYPWRGTRLENILEMKEKADKVVQLDTSFRVPSANLPLVNHIIDKLDLDLPHMTTTNMGGGHEIIRKPSQEAIREIMPKLLSVFYPHEIAILCRYNNQVAEYGDIVKEFTQNVNVINAKVGWNSKVGTKILMFIRFCLGSRNNYAVKSLLDAIEIDDPLVIRKWFIDSNVARTSGTDKSMIEVALESDNSSKTLIKDLLNLASRTDKNMAEKISYFYEAYITDRVQSSFYQVGDRVIFERIKWAIERFIKKHGNDERALYRWALTMDSQDFVDTDSNVNIMTYHVAKGLEFPVVVMPDIMDGVFPKNHKDLQADYRLFYVGITRSMNLLYLTSTGQSAFISDYLE